MYPDDRALLIVGETLNSPDAFYAMGFLFGDPAIFLDRGDGNSLLACTNFERDVAAAHSKARRVRGFRDYGGDDLTTSLPQQDVIAELTLRVLRDEGVARVVTTNDLPLYVADYLRARDIDLVCVPTLLSERRELKDATELEAIQSTQRATERAMQAAVDLIATASVGDQGILYSGGAVVTSQRLRAAIDGSLLEDNCSCDGTITASGPDSAQPHNRGSGPIHARQPIVIDIFPRDNERRYFADLTRTISKGVPHPDVLRMYDATNQALELAIGLIRPGVTGRSVWEAVCRFYEEQGYATYLREERTPDAGFIHSLGHGVGLAVHEGPSLGRRENVLREGEVITVEPGLYTPGFGGVRLEDLVVVTTDGCRNMTASPKVLVL